MQKTAVVAGHICLDIIPAVDHHFDLIPGHLYEVGASAMSTGGAVSNTGLTMHILGTPVTLMGKIGSDDFGKAIQEIICRRAPGLEQGMTVDAGSISSYTWVLNVPGIDRIFFHCPGANATYCAADVNWDAVANAALFHFGYPCFMGGIYADNGRELKEIYAHAKRLGATTSMDPGMPDVNGPAGKVDWKSVLAEVLPDTDVFMPSAEELLCMIEPESLAWGDNIPAADLHRLGEKLIGMGVAVCAIKMGCHGMYIRTAGAERLARMGRACPENVSDWADRECIFPVFTPDHFAGATGAGDASIGAFLCALLRSLPVEDAGLFAAAVGACNVEAPDSLSGIRSWEETRARIASGWKTTATQVSAPGWTLNERNVWVTGSGC